MGLVLSAASNDYASCSLRCATILSFVAQVLRGLCVQYSNNNPVPYCLQSTPSATQARRPWPIRSTSMAFSHTCGW
jgi:hypothetical protein